MPSGVIEPVEGDIYYYETMAELDAHEVEGDRALARRAHWSAKLLGLLFIVSLLALLVIFASQPLLQIGSVLVAIAAVVSWYLYDLLELCDD